MASKGALTRKVLVQGACVFVKGMPGHGDRSFSCRAVRDPNVEVNSHMSAKKRGCRPVIAYIESQDDIAYLTGRREQNEQEKQIKTPIPRRSGRLWRGRRKEEGDSDSREE